MKVWQAGSHLTMQRGAEVNDWSWAQTARRVSTLARLTAPYRARTLAIASLLAATATALIRPFWRSSPSTTGSAAATSRR